MLRPRAVGGNAVAHRLPLSTPLVLLSCPPLAPLACSTRSDESLYAILYNKIVADPDGCVVASLQSMPWGSCVPTVCSSLLSWCCFAPLAACARANLPLCFQWTCALVFCLNAALEWCVALVCCPAWEWYQGCVMAYNKMCVARCERALRPPMCRMV